MYCFILPAAQAIQVDRYLYARCLRHLVSVHLFLQGLAPLVLPAGYTGQSIAPPTVQPLDIFVIQVGLADYQGPPSFIKVSYTNDVAMRGSDQGVASRRVQTIFG